MEKNIVKDTNNRITWEETKALMKESGFELMLLDTFTPNRYRNEKYAQVRTFLNAVSKDFDEIEDLDEKKDFIEYVLTRMLEMAEKNNELYGINAAAKIIHESFQASLFTDEENIENPIESNREDIETFLKEEVSRTEELAIWVHPKTGIFIEATSQSWGHRDEHTINSGHIYAQGMLKEEYQKKENFHLYDHTEVNYNFGDDVLLFDTCIRNGILSFIENLSTYIDFLPKWENFKRDLWLVDYEQTQEINYNYDGRYDKIKLDRLSRCPRWVQEMVGYEYRVETVRKREENRKKRALQA